MVDENNKEEEEMNNKQRKYQNKGKVLNRFIKGSLKVSSHPVPGSVVVIKRKNNFVNCRVVGEVSGTANFTLKQIKERGILY